MSVEWEPMQGPDAAKGFVTEYLKADLPLRLQMYRNAWNVDDEHLALPKAFLGYEPVAIDTWPSVHTITTQTKSFVRVDYELDGDPIYRVTYAMRTYVWARGDNSEECTLRRDRLTTAVRSALLDYPCLVHADAQNREVRVDEGTMREEFSDLTPLKGERMMAGSYISYDLSLHEVVSRRHISDSLEVQLEAGSPITWAD